jgi:hypothetical protein
MWWYPEVMTTEIQAGYKHSRAEPEKFAPVSEGKNAICEMYQPGAIAG